MQKKEVERQKKKSVVCMRIGELENWTRCCSGVPRDSRNFDAFPIIETMY